MELLQMFILLSTVQLLMVGGTDHVSRKWHSHRHHHDHVHHWGPFFEELPGGSVGLGIVVPLGGAVDLNCKVAMLHDKTVMWLRQSYDKVSLLTVGQSLYSSDPRITIKFQYPSNWRLHISPIQREDEGQYVCQVSTHPPRTLLTNLTVLAPELKIIDEHGHSVHDRYYKTGSTIDLTCKVMTFADTGTVKWYKDGHTLSDKVKLSYLSDKVVEGVSFTRVVIPRASKTDSGTYACTISKHSTVLVHVTVLNGEYHAAVQHDTWSSSGNVCYSNVWLTSLLWMLSRCIM